MTTHVRNVVTVGRASDARVAFDGPAPTWLDDPRVPLRVWDVWSQDGPTTLATDERRPARRTYFPRGQGHRALMIEWPPRGVTASEPDEAQAVRDRAMTGYAEDIENPTGQPRFHATRTLDIGVVVEGELTLSLPDGDVVLGPGHTIVQQGAPHAWRNDGDVPCRALFVVLGVDEDAR